MHGGAKKNGRTSPAVSSCYVMGDFVRWTLLILLLPKQFEQVDTEPDAVEVAIA